MDLREIGYEDGRWMELAQDRVQWRALVLAVLNLRVMEPVFDLGVNGREAYSRPASFTLCRSRIAGSGRAQFSRQRKKSEAINSVAEDGWSRQNIEQRSPPAEYNVLQHRVDSANVGILEGLKRTTVNSRARYTPKRVR
jgi:hypothetical protein